MRCHYPVDKKISKQLLISASGAFLLFVSLASLLFDIYPSSNLVTCTVRFEKENQLQLFYAPGQAGNHFNEKDSVFSGIVPGRKI